MLNTTSAKLISADKPQSRAVLDAYTEAGGNFVDTSNSYLVEHGRSETIIGRWLAERGNRDQIVIATKVGGGAVRCVTCAPRRSRERHTPRCSGLQVDHIDLYYAHFDDEATPLEESLRAFDDLVQAGVVRCLGASNYTPQRLTAALELQRRHGLAEFTVLHYNLGVRDFERAPAARRRVLGPRRAALLRARQGLPERQVPGGESVDSPRAEGARAYRDRSGAAVLAVLDEIATAHETTVAAVAISWLRTRPRWSLPSPARGAPISSRRSCPPPRWN
jgi:aryl-alcohol dehydrogenase-like predicted oxidoreductase